MTPWPPTAEPAGSSSWQKEDGHIVGTAAFHPLPQKLAIIRRFYVSAGFRGKGVGRELLSRIEGLCKERGNALIVAVSEHGFKRAFGIYIKDGFVPFRTEPENFLVKYLAPGADIPWPPGKMAKMNWYFQWKGDRWVPLDVCG